MGYGLMLLFGCLSDIALEAESPETRLVMIVVMVVEMVVEEDMTLMPGSLSVSSRDEESERMVNRRWNRRKYDFTLESGHSKVIFVYFRAGVCSRAETRFQWNANNVSLRLQVYWTVSNQNERWRERLDPV